jgi:hypothetical protein
LPERLAEGDPSQSWQRHAAIAFALTEQSGGTGRDLKSRAQGDGETWRISGEKHLITFADRAKHFIRVTATVRRRHLDSVNSSKESLVVGRAEELPDCLPEPPCGGTSHEGTVRRLADPRADQIEMIGTFGLLQYLKAEIAIDSTRGGGKFEQRPLDSRPVLRCDVHMRDGVESCL